jgi:hypothetical protein
LKRRGAIAGNAKRWVAFSQGFSLKGEFFHNIHRGVFRGFLGIEKRPSRRSHVFPKKTWFIGPTFCRWDKFTFS